MIVFLLIYIALVLIRPQDYPGMANLGIPVLPLALLLAFGVWVIERQHKSFNSPTFILFAAFTLVAMVSVAVNGWVGGALVRLTEFLPMLIAFVLVAQAAQSPRNVLRIMATFVLCSLVLVVHGIEQVELGAGWTGMPTVQDGRIQYVGIFSDPNDLAMLFVMSIPMALLLSAGGGLLGLRRLWWWLAVALMLYGVYLTDSRGALLAVMAMLGVWIWRRRGVVTAGLLGAGGLAVLMMLPTRMQELDASEASAYGRIDAWYEGTQMFIANPLFGVGVGNFTEHNYLTAHNSFVLVLAETGIIGFTIWLALVGYPLLMTLAVIRHRPELPDARSASLWRGERAAATTLLISMVGFFACAFFLSRSYVIILYLLLGLITGWYMGAQQRWPGLPVFRLQDDLVRWGMIALGSAVALWLVVKVLLMMAWS